MSIKKKSIEQRIEEIEKWITGVKPIIAGLAKEYDLQKPRVNPTKYCKDTLDKQILNYLIDKNAAGTTEIATGLDMKNPAKARHTIGKRLIRIQKQALAEGWHILTFEGAQKELPGTTERKYRAWWVDLEDIDVAAFKKELQEAKTDEKQFT